jgi:hypothetical protein
MDSIPIFHWFFIIRPTVDQNAIFFDFMPHNSMIPTHFSAFRIAKSACLKAGALRRSLGKQMQSGPA